MANNTFTLSNGLRIIHTFSPTDVAYCGLCIDAGTRDEEPQESGMAHFIEHLLFKGTTHRKSWHILNRLETVGGDLNAYTNKEETVVYAAFLKENFERALDLICDIVFNSTFPQQEIDKEVDVIIDEIQSYEDSPSELIFDEFENMIFSSHPLGRNILGNPNRLKEYTSEDAKRFVQRYYWPSNMVFFVRGNIPFEKVIRLCEKHTNGIVLPQGWKRQERIKPAPYQAKEQRIHRDTHQAHVMLGCRSFDALQGKRTGLYLLNNILGGPGMNSRLNVSLREKKGLVYNVESNLTNYTDTGTFCIYLGCDIDDVNQCIDLCHKELQKVLDSSFTDAQLNAAKKQIKGQIGVACDNFESNILDMAKAYLHYNKVEELHETFQRIDNLTPQGLQEIALELFNRENLSLLTYE